MPQLLNRLIPFILLGFALLAISFGMILLIYLFLFATIIGVILYCIRWFREKFFTASSRKKRAPSQKQGRVIDSNDFREI